MKRFFALSSVIAGLMLSSQAIALVGFDLNLYYAQRAMDADDWPELTRLPGFGFGANLKLPIVPFDISFDYFTHEASETDTESTVNVKTERKVTDMHLGIKKGFGIPGIFRPYIGAGYSDVQITQINKFDGADLEDVRNEKLKGGFWLGAGAYATLGVLNLGVDLRHSIAEAEFLGEESKAFGATHTALFIGYHF